ncbi:MAG: hypothetical protein BWY79_00935 [Actinobacteria bacterium ADurb.Bin444]|nr:MAG: hypothetical protein BWY79_00935 [Actinobacteria bacterium ADurb.Bin444]
MPTGRLLITPHRQIHSQPAHRSSRLEGGESVNSAQVQSSLVVEPRFLYVAISATRVAQQILRPHFRFHISNPATQLESLLRVLYAVTYTPQTEVHPRRT